MKASTEPQKEENKHPQLKLERVIGLNLNEYKLNNYGLPIVLDVLISACTNNPHFMEAEGIFRKNASYKKLVELELLLKKK